MTANYDTPARSPYLFEKNPLAILPVQRRPGEFGAHVRRLPGIRSQRDPGKYSPHAAPRTSHNSLPNNTKPAAFYPLPSKLACIHELPYSPPLESRLAVIVSPHYDFPTAERVPASPVAKKPYTKPAPAPAKLDGNSSVDRAPVPTSTSMTDTSMGSKQDENGGSFPLRNQRPSIVSHHSNSVPSTPIQVARKYESRSRSPSPNGGLGSHSPRSTVSETNSTMPARRPANRQTKCPYETNLAFGRRRIPYHSSDLLEKAKEEPKQTLDPHEEKKLTGDMRAMYDRLLPSKENTQRRDLFVKKLQTILETKWPGTEFKVHVFGSSGNMLYTSESDVDVCIATPMKQLEEMHQLADVLAKNGMENVVCIPQAKVRIVKIWDPVLKLACDMNVNNTLALENTRMIKTYVQIDERVRQLAMIVKYWTKRRILNDAAFGGTLSSYTWICMILNFLQTRDPPILPSLHKLANNEDNPKNGEQKTDFADDLSKLVGFGEANKESLGQLLFHFFRRYGHEFDYENYVVSVRHGCLLKREEKNWHLLGLQKEARNRLCVEEPFNTERNLGNSADEFAWRGIHLELRRAFDLLADGQQLDKTCEQFEFPPEDKSATNLFEKPRPTKTTLTSSVPARGGGRGGLRGGGGRGNYQKGGNNNYNRRASSGASFNRPPFTLHSPPIGMAPQQDYFQRDFPRGLNEQLHDQLFQQYQMLEMQSNTLRQQLAAQQRAQQAHHSQQVQAAHMHAQAVAQAQAQHNRGAGSQSGSPQKSPYINGRSSPRLSEAGIMPNSFPPGFIFQYPAFFDPSQAQGVMVQDSSRTNPSSPSLTNTGLRRQVHRASNASETNTLRSHSQPPRGLPQQPVIAGYAPMPQYYDPQAFAGYQISRPAQEVPTSAPTTDAQASPLPNYPEVVAPPNQDSPKEYVGYYVEEQPTRSLQEYTVPQIPSYSELAQRRRRVSTEMAQPLLNSALRRASRSPSPLGGHMRSYSSNVPLPSGASVEPRKDRTDSTRPPADNGPMIVNGSYPTQPRESRSRSGTVETLPPMEELPTPLGIFVNGDQYRMIRPEEREQLVAAEMRRQSMQDTMEPPIVNGNVNDTAPMDMSGLVRVSSAQGQAYPVLPDGWINYNMANGSTMDRSEEISPTRVQPQQPWKAPVSSYTNGLPSLDTMNAPRPPPQEIKSATLPLLSPVFETRTPSPTMNRQQNGSKPPNHGKIQVKENNVPAARQPSHTPAQAPAPKDTRNSVAQKGGSQANDKNKPNSGSAGNNGHGSNAGNGGNSNSNAWQQQPKKNRKKAKGSNKANENKNTSEPLPANAADRKGG